jgi:hypothetical protein
MATTLTPFPTVPPMPFMPAPPMPDDLHKTIRATVENTIIDVMNNPSSELGNIIKKHVKESMECKEVMDKLSKKVHGHMHNIEDKDDEKSDLEFLFCEIVDHHKHIKKGKSIFEIEGEISEKHKDMSPEETRVLSCLLRSDGPVRLSGMINMDVDDFIETMRHLGKRFKH